jgi:CHAD domain-containing protein
MVRMSSISITEKQKQNLLELSQSAPELYIRRARLILAYADGKPTMQAALQAGISRGRARYWKRQFLSKGMGIFNLDSDMKVLGEEPHQLNDRPTTGSVSESPSEKLGHDNLIVQEEIPFPLPLKNIGVTADDSLAEAGRKIWLYHFAIMLSHEQGTLLGEDIEELHDMRVATRRMRSAFDIFGSAFDPKIMKRYLKGLRSIGRVLGQVRDMDVILEKGLIYQGKLEERDRSGVDPLMIAWKQIIDTERGKLTKHLKSEAYLRFKQDFNRFLQAPMSDKGSSSPGNEAISRIRDIVPVLVYSRYAAVRAYETILPTASIGQLHALRIEFKKFRYSLEYFREILNECATKSINEIKQYQDHLGELHDADVACQLVRGFLKSWEENQIRLPIQERINPEPIVSYLAYLHAERYRLMLTFPELWQNFNRTEFRQNLAKAISLL